MTAVVLVHGANHGPWVGQGCGPLRDVDCGSRPKTSTEADAAAPRRCRRRAMRAQPTDRSSWWATSEVTPSLSPTIDGRHLVLLGRDSSRDGAIESLGNPVVDGLLGEDGQPTAHDGSARTSARTSCTPTATTPTSVRLRPATSHPVLAAPSVVSARVARSATTTSSVNTGRFDHARLQKAAAALVDKSVSWPRVTPPFLSQPISS